MDILSQAPRCEMWLSTLASPSGVGPGFLRFCMIHSLIKACCQPRTRAACKSLVCVHLWDFPFPQCATSIIKDINLQHPMPCYDTAALPFVQRKTEMYSLEIRCRPEHTLPWKSISKDLKLDSGSMFNIFHLLFGFLLILLFPVKLCGCDDVFPNAFNESRWAFSDKHT